MIISTKKVLFILLGFIALPLLLSAGYQAGKIYLSFQSFKGIEGEDVLGVDLMTPADMMNFEIQRTGGSTLLRQRDGFASIGSGLPAHPIRGINRHTPSGGPYQMLVASGCNLYTWSEANERFVGANASLLSGTCVATSGSDTLYGNRTNWFALSQYAVDTIKVNEDTVLIEKILGDTVIVLVTDYGSSDSTAACTIWASSTIGSSTIFEDAYTKKRSTMFKDTLVIVDGDSLVKYYGGGATGLLSMDYGTALNLRAPMNMWYSDFMTIRVEGVNKESVPGRWYQAQNKNNLDYNLALYCIDNNWNFRIDKPLVDAWLSQAADTSISLLLWPEDSVEFSNVVLQAKISTVTMDSLKTGRKDYLTINGLLNKTIKQFYTSEELDWVWFERTRSVYRYNYVYRYTITVTDVSGWPDGSGVDIPLDTLRNMTFLASDISTSTTGANSGNIGYWVDQLPIIIDTTDAGDTTIEVSSYGPGGVWVKDTTAWEVSRYGQWHSSLCNDTTYWDIEEAIDAMCIIEDADRTLAVVYDYRDREIFHVADSADYQRGDAATAFEANDSLNLIGMVRMGTETDPVISSALLTHATDYSLIHNQMNRLWLSGHSHEDSSTVVSYCHHSKGDSVIGYEIIRKAEGAQITALSGWDNYIFAHMYDGIAAIVCHTSSNYDVDNPIVAGTPSNVYTTEANYGAVSQEALCHTESGDIFVGTDGIFLFSGGPLQKLSEPINFIFADSVDRAKLGNACIAVHQGKLYVSLTFKGANVNNRTLIYDIPAQTWIKTDIGASLFLSEIGIEERQGLYFGSPHYSDGYVLEYGAAAKDTGQYIDSWWLSGVWPGQGIAYRENLQKTHWWVYGNATARFNLDIYMNHGSSAFSGLVRPGSAAWSINALPLMGDLQSEVFQFRIELDSAEGAKIRQLDVAFTPAGEAIQ